jgi:uncharacterized protein
MPKKIPMRRCVATGEQLPKKELLRIVRTPEGNLEVDVTGRANGRGAYLKKDSSAVDIAKKNKALEKSLEVKIPDEFYDTIKTYIK